MPINNNSELEKNTMKDIESMLRDSEVDIAKSKWSGAVLKALQKYVKALADIMFKILKTLALWKCLKAQYLQTNLIAESLWEYVWEAFRIGGLHTSLIQVV